MFIHSFIHASHFVGTWVAVLGGLEISHDQQESQGSAGSTQRQASKVEDVIMPSGP